MRGVLGLLLVGFGLFLAYLVIFKGGIANIHLPKPPAPSTPAPASAIAGGGGGKLAAQ